MKRIVLAYDGLAVAPAVIPQLEAAHGAEVVALTLDLGQGEELTAVQDRARSEGAVRAHVLDVREEFASGFVLPVLRAGAQRDERIPLAKALGRAMVAAKLVEVARIENAGGIAYVTQASAARRGSSIDTALASLDPSLQVVHVPQMEAPAGDGRAGTDRVDVNLWARSVTFRSPCATEIPEDVYAFTRPRASCPDEPAVVDITFEAGTPVAINGVRMPLIELIASLNAIAGAHGVGRLRSTQPDAVLEAPAATVLHAAHQLLQAQLTPVGLDRFSRIVAIQYADLAEQGQWFTPLREALDAFVDRVQAPLTGDVRAHLLKGGCRMTRPESHGDRGPAALPTAGHHLVTT